ARVVQESLQDGSLSCMSSCAYPYAWIATGGTPIAAPTRPAQSARASAGRTGGVGSGGSVGLAAASVGAGGGPPLGAAPGFGPGRGTTKRPTAAAAISSTRKTVTGNHRPGPRR